MDILNLLLIIVIGGLIYGFVIWVVSKLRLGLEVDGFVSAFIAAIIISMVGVLVYWLLRETGIGMIVVGRWLGWLFYFIITASVLMISDRLYKGIRVSGGVGVVIAALAIGAVYFLFGWLINVLLV